MKKIILFLFFTLLIKLCGYSQGYPVIWYFGNKAGIDFNLSPPVSINNSVMNTQEGCCTVTDTSGNLMFYTNGEKIWNSQHEIMENGDDLKGYFSSTQSVAVVKKPLHANILYVFTVDGIENSLNNGLRYSVVDMSLDNGLGAVTNQKNILLYAKSTEKIFAVKASNGIDYWIITHEWNSDAFYTYRVTPDGINTTPVVTHAGPICTGSLRNAIGQLKVSSNKKKLAMAIESDNIFVLYDFNDSTGIISNPQIINFTNGRPYGIEFSPNSSILYVNSWDPGGSLYQYNLDDLKNGTLITPIKIYTANYYEQLGGMQIGPDNKIYLGMRHKNYLGIINDPDAVGTNCNFIKKGINLNENESRFGLPSYLIAYYFSIDFSSEKFCFGDSTIFVINNDNVDSLHWNFGDSLSGISNFSNLHNPKHVFSKPGLYSVTLSAWKDGYVYTLSHIIEILKGPEIDIGNDTVICSGNNLILHAGSGYNSYLWQDGSQDSIYVVGTSGTYWVTVENECGTASDTVNVTFTQSFDIDLGADTALCYGNTITLSPGGNFAGYQWQDGSGDSAFTVYQTGLYWVTVHDSVGCSATDSILIQIFQSFNFSLGNDTAICYGDYLFLNGPQGYSSYLWQNGSQYSSIIADTSGIYWLEVGDTNNCKARDSLVLTVDKIPDNFIVSDTLMCKDSTSILRTHPLFEQYFWQDGSQDSTLTIADTGKYWVTVFDSIGCSGSDTVDIGYYPELALQLQSDGYLCDDDSVVLTAISNYDNYLWQDSSQNSIYIARDSGIYWVKVSSACETKSDTIVIDACSSIWVPNVFTPNNDGYNDYFYAVGKNIPKFKMVIFNRWGQTLKVLNNIIEKWDGTYKGHTVSEGTYFWVADFEQVERGGAVVHKRLQGSVTLVK